MPTSPNVLNYFIGKGNLYFTPAGGEERHLGNAPEVEITPEIERLDHFSSMTGIRSKDRSVILEKSMTIRMVLEEMTVENVRLMLLGGTATLNSAGNAEFEMFTENAITGALRFAGSNSVGNQVNITMPSVSFTPSGSLSLISDEWGNLEVTAEILAVDGSFGTVELVETEEETA